MPDVEILRCELPPWWCGIVMKNVAICNVCWLVVVWCRMWKMMQCVVRCHCDVKSCGGVM